MQELSLNVLDIVQNSVKAKASLIKIIVSVNPFQKTMEITIIDDGCGMTDEQVKKVINPFFTTRTTRKVGLGVPFFKMSADMTGGDFKIESEISKGTKIWAFYHTDHLDMMPLGDMAATMVSLISVNPDIDFIYTYNVIGLNSDDETANSFVMSTKEIKAIMEGLPINSPDVLSFIKDFINQNSLEINTKNKIQ